MSSVIPVGWSANYLGDNVAILSDFAANGSFGALLENVDYFGNLNYAALVIATDFEKPKFEPERFTD